MTIEEILARYPKTHPPLPEAYKKIYDEHYRGNREGEYVATSLSQKLEAWMHKKVAQDAAPEKRTLEIGAGNLNQFAFEAPGVRYDIVEPYPKLFEGSVYLPNVSTIYADIADVPDGTEYDRITSVAALEHIGDLPVVLARAALLLAKGGVVRSGIPNEGTIMWRLGTEVTGAEFRLRFGLDYQVLMRHEHVNSAYEIEQLFEYFFEENKRAVFGPHKWLGFYRFYESRKPHQERARAYLAGRGLLVAS